MTVEIYAGFEGRAIEGYELLDEMIDRYALDRRDAHESIRTFLGQLAEDENVILDRRPVRPALLTANPNDLDITYWETVSETTAEQIRDAFAAVYTETA